MPLFVATEYFKFILIVKEYKLEFQILIQMIIKCSMVIELLPRIYRISEEKKRQTCRYVYIRLVDIVFKLKKRLKNYLSVSI